MISNCGQYNWYQNRKNHKNHKNRKKHIAVVTKNLKFIYLFQKKTLIKNNFLDTSLNENDEKKKENEQLKEKLKSRDKSIAYKNIGLERKIKILEQRNNHLIKKYKLQSNTIFN